MEDILHKSDPWQGQDCLRENCLLCKTKEKTAKNKTQDCYKRSIVYQTWCMTCWDRDLEKATVESNGDKKKLEELEKKIIPLIYVGESCRITFEVAGNTQMTYKT